MKKFNYIYQLKNVSFSYFLGSQQIEAVKNITMEIPNESLVTFSGPSGSGKSTLLNILGLIEPLQKGRSLFQNEDIAKMSRKQDETNPKI